MIYLTQGRWSEFSCIHIKHYPKNHIYLDFVLGEIVSQDYMPLEGIN